MATNIVLMKFSADSAAGHELLVRRIDEKKIVILNVPPWCSEPNLKGLLTETCGPVQSVDFISKDDLKLWLSSNPPEAPKPKEPESPYFKKPIPFTFHDVLIVFKSPKGVDQIMEREKANALVVKSETRQPLTGMKRWSANYRESIITDWDGYEKDIDEYMKAYDARKEEEGKKLKEMGEEADEEGWVTVTSKSKKAGVKNSQKDQERAKAKAKAAGEKKELLNFYKFQEKEKKEDLIQNLRQKFEEDKKKVANMKAERRFRPY